MPNWKKVIVSGSDAALNSLYVTRYVTGSLFGTSSWAISSSNSISSSTALTASYVNPLKQQVIVTGSLIVSASGAVNDLVVGTNKLFVSASGNVGIGTITPTQRLSVSGGLVITGSSLTAPLILSDGNYIYGGGVTGSTTAIFGVTSNQTELYARNNKIGIWGSGGGTNYLYCDTGNFGIGIGAVTPSARLYVSGANNATLLRVSSPSNDSILFVSGNSYIGIGTTSPTQKLQVSGSVYLEGANCYLYLRDTSTKIYEGSGLTLDSGASDRPIKFYINGAEKMRVNTTGNVGIGTTAPNAKLDVNGDVIVTGSLIISSSLTRYSSIAAVTSGSTSNVASLPTSSYTSGFFKYVTTSGTNARAGEVFTVWNGSNVEYTEVSTNDIGNTSNLILSASLSGANILLQATSLSGSWSVKTSVLML